MKPARLRPRRQHDEGPVRALRDPHAQGLLLQFPQRPPALLDVQLHRPLVDTSTLLDLRIVEECVHRLELACAGHFTISAHSTQDRAVISGPRLRATR